MTTATYNGQDTPPERALFVAWLILDSRGVIGQVCRNRLFLRAFPEGHGRCGILGKSCLISNA
jgi:hypothetical protein